MAPADPATTMTAHSSSATSMSLPTAVSGFLICDETVRSSHRGEERRLSERLELRALGVAFEEVHRDRCEQVDRRGCNHDQCEAREEPAVMLPDGRQPAELLSERVH